MWFVPLPEVLHLLAHPALLASPELPLMFPLRDLIKIYWVVTLQHLLRYCLTQLWVTSSQPLLAGLH